MSQAASMTDTNRRLTEEIFLLRKNQRRRKKAGIRARRNVFAEETVLSVWKKDC